MNKAKHPTREKRNVVLKSGRVWSLMNRFDGKEAADEMLHNSTALVSLKFKYPAPTHNFSKERVTDVQRGMKTC